MYLVSEEERQKKIAYMRQLYHRRCAHCKKKRYCNRLSKDNERICKRCHVKENHGEQAEEIKTNSFGQLSQDKRPKRYKKDRTCKVCGTPLSTYNKGETCFLHKKATIGQGAE